MFPSRCFSRFVAAAGLLVALLCRATVAVEPETVIKLWPGEPPGETRARGPEHKVEGRPRPFYQLTDITVPSLEIFPAPKATRNGTAVLVCPGGGMQRLAYEHEGLEVAQWLNSLGITAAVLKYRVPSPAETGGIDAQRALSLMRSRAAEWKLDPHAIGFMGFSAGGEIGVWLMTHSDARLYPAMDAVDQVSCRPDFVALVYPGGLLTRGAGLKEPLNSGIRSGLPPVFIAQAFDDTSQEALAIALALKRVGVPTEVHIYREGGHGFGVRSTGIPTSSWKSRCVDWLAGLGFLDAPGLRDFVDRTASVVLTPQAPPRISDLLPDSTLEDAYRAQIRLVRTATSTNSIAGFKAAAASAAVQKTLGLEGPLAGVVFKSGRYDGTTHPVIPLREGQPIVVETEVGYLISVDLSYEVLNDEQVRGAVESVVPIIELPRSYPNSGPANARNMVAANVGSDRFLVGAPIKAEQFDPDSVPVTLRRDGQVINQTTGAAVAGGQWHNLRLVLNELTRHGYVIPAGSVILGGALGKIQPGEKGSYEADYGPLGKITFELR